MKPLFLVSIIGSALMAGGVFIASDFPGAGATSTGYNVERSGVQQTTNAQTVALRVDNMSCASCPYIVRQALEGTPGVISAEVSFWEKSAVVAYDPTKTEVAALIKATSDIGYPSRQIGN